MALSVERLPVQEVILNTIVTEQGGEASGSSPISKPRVLGNIGQILRNGSLLVVDGFNRIIAILEVEVFEPTKQLLLRAGGGNGMPATESGPESSSDLEAGGGLPSHSASEGFNNTQADQDILLGTMVSEDDSSGLLHAAEYAKNPRAYFLLYAFYSSIQTLKEEIPNPTPAQRALWYLLSINTGTLFVLFVMLTCVPRGSVAAALLLKIMYRVGLVSFGLNLALLYAKYQP